MMALKRIVAMTLIGGTGIYVVEMYFNIDVWALALGYALGLLSAIIGDSV